MPESNVSAHWWDFNMTDMIFLCLFYEKISSHENFGLRLRDNILNTFYTISFH